MGKNESIRDSVADVRVHAADVHVNAGKWIIRNFVSGTTTYKCTAAVTVMFPFVTITAAAAGFVTVGTTATATAIMACTSTVAGTFSGFSCETANFTNLCVITAPNTNTAVEIPAGNEILVCAANSVAGKYGFMLISTP